MPQKEVAGKSLATLPTKVANQVLGPSRVKVKRLSEGMYVVEVKWQAGSRKGTVQAFGQNAKEALGLCGDQLRKVKPR